MTVTQQAQQTDNNIAIVKKVNIGFQKCRCKYIVPLDDKRCGCLKFIAAHDFKARSIYDRMIGKKDEEKTNTWTKETCTEDDGDTNACGKVIFPGIHDTPAQYIRVSFRTDMDEKENKYKDEMTTMKNFIFNKWKLTKPKLLISVTGGTNVSLDQRMRESFSKSLFKAATTTHAWITSGGSYAGCMKVVGEAFKQNSSSLNKEDKVVVLGIANWCSVTNYERLINIKNQVEIKSEVEYDLGGPRSKETKNQFIDPYHTHFILVDDAKHEFGGEVEFRAALETSLTKNEVPVVVLVIGGGPLTAKSVYAAVKDNKPCVFLDSSGEFATIFCFAIKLVEEKAKQDKKNEKKLKKEKSLEKIEIDDKNFHLDIRIEQQIRNRLHAEYPKLDPIKVEKIISFLTMCLNPKYAHLLTVCRPVNSKLEVDIAILRALLKKAEKENIKHSENKTDPAVAQLRLALEWNRVDIAKKFIFTDEVKDRVNTFGDIMYDAIKTNKIDFVELFLDSGFSLRNFLTHRIMLNLYNDINEGPFYKKLMNASSLSLSGKRIFTHSTIGEGIEDLVHDFYRHHFTKHPFNKVNYEMANKIINDTDEFGRIKEKRIGIFHLPDMLFNSDDRCKYPEHELFMYSVLQGWSEMGKLFCINGRNPICSCLFAVKISNTYSSLFDDDSGKFTDMANFFRDLAVGTLDKCYETDPASVEQAILKRVPEFGNVTCMQAATTFNILKVIAHPSFQEAITKVWYHKIYPDTSTLAFFISLACPLLAPLLIEFKDTSSDNTVTELDEAVKEGKNDPFKENKGNDEHMANLHGHILTKRDLKELFDDDYVKSNDNASFDWSYFNNVLSFLEAPQVKFFYHQISYVMFLTLLSYVTLCDFWPLNRANPVTSRGLAISIPEIILHIWVATISLDEFRTFQVSDHKIFKAKVKSFLGSSWGVVTVLALLLYLVCFVLRFIPNDKCFQAARIILSLDVLLWYLKALYMYTISKELGPKLLMIKKMMIELMWFCLLLTVAVFTVGVSTQGLMFGRQTPSIEILRQLFFPAFWKTTTSVYTLRSIVWFSSIDKCTPDIVGNTFDSCPDQGGATVTIIIYIFYQLGYNVLLLNILIAIFNNVYSRIDDLAIEVWKSQRHEVIVLYYHKPLLPPPFIIISYMSLLVRYVAERLIVKLGAFRNKYSSEFKEVSLLMSLSSRVLARQKVLVHEFKNEAESKRVIQWEEFMTNEFLFDKKKESKEQTDSKLKVTTDKLDVIWSKFSDFVDNGDQELSEVVDIVQDCSFVLLKALKKA